MVVINASGVPILGDEHDRIGITIGGEWSMKVDCDTLFVAVAMWRKAAVSVAGMRTLKAAPKGILTMSWLKIAHFLAEFEYHTPIAWLL